MKIKNSYLVFADAQDEAKYIQSGGMMGELILSEIKMADPVIDDLGVLISLQGYLPIWVEFLMID